MRKDDLNKPNISISEVFGMLDRVIETFKESNKEIISKIDKQGEAISEINTFTKTQEVKYLNIEKTTDKLDEKVDDLPKLIDKKNYVFYKLIGFMFSAICGAYGYTFLVTR